MFRLFLLILAPLLSLITFTLGSGLLTTLLTIRLHIHGEGPWIIGLLTTVYYAGMVLGSFFIGRVIKRVGHIRVYATCAALLAASVMLQGIIITDFWWLVFRFITGYCTAGLYVAIESWLLVISPEKRRGQVLSLYMISFYAALAGGQFFLNAADPKTAIPFSIVTILCTLSIVPIAMTRAACPAFEDIAALSIRKLYKVSGSGVIGCLAGGLMTSVVYGLMPLFANLANFSIADVALMMGVTILGAMLLQYPVGRVSDRVERRKVLVAVAFATLGLSLLMMITMHVRNMFLLFAFIFGGVSFTIYPLSINLVCDYLGGRDIVAATQGLLLVNGIGSIIGPLLVPFLFKIFGASGLFIYFAIISCALGCYFAWRRTQKSATPVEEQQEFVALPRNTPIASELNPNVEER